jgi:fumarate reductase flavoprotein subunit
MSRFERYQRAKAPIYEHETIEGLAREAGIGIEESARAVTEYNDAIRTNRAGDLVPPNTRKLPRPIRTPKFYAIPFRGGMTATFGGPLINAKAQVISTEEKIIPGLYAAGNAAGGLLYGDYIVGSQMGGGNRFRANGGGGWLRKSPVIFYKNGTGF